MNKTSLLKSSITLNDLNFRVVLNASLVKSILQVCVKLLGTSRRYPLSVVIKNKYVGRSVSLRPA